MPDLTPKEENKLFRWMILIILVAVGIVLGITGGIL